MTLPLPGPASRMAGSAVAAFGRLLPPATVVALWLLVPDAGVRLAAQASPPASTYFRRIIDRELGLPESQVNSIAQTPDGYLWLGTRRGVVRYDGLTFTTYSPTNTPALPGYWVNAVSVDRRGRLWIATRRGLAVKDASGFRRVATGRPDAAVWRVFEDSRGRIWVPTDSGLLVGDGDHFRMEPSIPGYTYALAEDSVGRVWIAGRGFLAVRVNDRTIDLTPMFRDKRRFFDLLVDGPDHVWVGTRTGAFQLTWTPHGSPSITRRISTRAGREERAVWSLGLTRDRILWIGTATNGTLLWDGHELKPFAADAKETWTFLTDRRGVLWAGTSTGLERYQRQAFASINEGLPDRSLWSVRRDPTGAMWAALSSGAIYQWNGTRFEERLHGTGTAVSTPIWPVSGGMLAAQGGTLLIVGPTGRRRPVAAADLPPGEVYGMATDPGGAIWISADSGLFRLDRGSAKSMNRELGFGPTERPRDMIVDSQGRFLIGTPGLSILDRSGKRHYGAAEGLSDPTVNAVLPRGDRIWLATADSGLYLLRGERITAMGHIDPRLQQELISLSSDHLGYLWLIGRYGLWRVDERTLEAAGDAGKPTAIPMQAFDASDGIGSASFEMDFQRSIAKDTLGRLWIPGTDGVVVVDPSRVAVDSLPPQSHIERIRVDGTPLPNGGALRLPVGVGRLEITFATTDLTDPRRARVQYRMLGVDTSWVDAGMERKASFGPLRGGRYRFEVRAAGETGRFGPPGASQELEVALALSERRWFLPALVFATAGVVLIGFRARQRALVERGKALTRIVADRTADLEAARATLEAKVVERTSQLAGELAERERLEHQLVEAQKLEGLGRLAGGVAHEINNSMTAVLGFTELAIAGTRDRAGLCANLEEARRAGERVASITKQLLLFARRQQAQLIPLDLGEVVERMTRTLTQAIGDQVTVSTTTLPHLPMVRADRPQLEQVILNLAFNARDAMPNGGRLTLQVGSRTRSSAGPAGGADLPAGDYVTLSVGDTGTGMTEQVRARLFEPFFTTKGRTRGTGLGLAVCHGIVAEHGGAIEVDSTLGKGTTFHIWLPTTGPTPSAAHHAEREDPGPGSGTETILVVEDDELVREVVGQLLGDRGYQVLRTEEGAAALDLLAERPGAVDLVLTDVLMPTMNGLELARAIRQRQLDVPIAFMSGFTGDDKGMMAELANYGPLLQKPFSSADVAGLVRRVLDGQHIDRES